MKRLSFLSAMILALVLAIGPGACASRTDNAVEEMDSTTSADGAYCPKNKEQCERAEGAEGCVCPHKKKKCEGECPRKKECTGERVCPHKDACPGGEACGHPDCPGGEACPRKGMKDGDDAAVQTPAAPDGEMPATN